jgi:ABC-type lipoprotein export system ATPase subunit
VLSATDLSVRLPDGRVLFSGVHAQIRVGEAAVIVGPSGIGKSTLLFVLGGLLQATSGTLTRATERSAAWVLQSLNGLAARSAIDNAAAMALVDGIDPRTARARARSELEAVGLGSRASQRANTMSGGELQRVAVARVLACDRPLVLADEPTNQLDADNARLVMRRVVRAADDGRCVVIVTHDRDALPTGCRMLRLSAGGLVEE